MAKAVQPLVVGLKNPQLPLTAFFNKKITLTFLGVFALLSSHATIYYNTTAGTGDATVFSNWTTDPSGATLVAPPSDFNEGDTFVIRSGSTVTSSGPWTINNANVPTATAILDIEGTFTPGSSLSLSGSFINDGAFNCGSNTVTLGEDADIDGTQPTTFNVLNIDDPNAVVPVITPTALVTIQDGGSLNLINGSLNLEGITLACTNAATINITGGNLANAADGLGDDAGGGGTLELDGTFGAVVTVIGNAVFNNITTVGGTGHVDLDLQAAATTINGTMTIKGIHSDSFELTSNPPIWGSTSTLSVNNNGKTYLPGTATRLEWTQQGSGTIGVTPGYPNNVTLLNLGTAAGHGAGFDPTGTWAIDGVLSVGNSVTPAKVSVEDMASFTSGGIAIANASSLRGDNITDKGNWTQTGSTLGTYTEINNGTVTFAGSGNSTFPQVVSVASGVETSFINLAIANNTYVKLLSPVTIPDTGLVRLFNGKIETSATHLLTLNNTSTSGITGGNAGALTWIVGPIQWALAAGSPTATYLFPTGTATGYYPFSLNASTSGLGTSATVTPFAAASGGTPDGVTVRSQSVTEYWSLTTTNPLLAGSSVGIQRPSAVNPPYDLIAESLVKTGFYSSKGGTFNGLNGYTNSNDIGAGSSFFFLFGNDNIVTPVRFIDIKASLKNSNEALVQWLVGDQDGIVSYTIEKSTDDINFTGIGSVPATGNISSILNYSFTDANLTGDTYYKIAAIDAAGDVSYSYVAEVGDASTASLATVTVYPNPSTGSTIGLLTNNVPAGSYTVTLQNAGGQIVYTSVLNHSAGVTTETIAPSSYLQPGTYYLALASAAGTKFVVTVVVIH